MILTRFITRLYARHIISGDIRHFHLNACLQRSAKINLFDLNFDRRIKVDYKDSINYMKSQTYEKIYNGHKVWELYRRNHKAPKPSKNTRWSCVNDSGFLNTSYPCPVCRDEYLVVHHENVDLLSQFINKYTGKVMTTQECHVCRTEHRKIQIAIIKAKDMGLLITPVPNRLYNYNDYDQLKVQQ